MRAENKIAYEEGGVWDCDGEEKKNMPVAEKRNQTSSLLTQAHREEERGEIKVEKHTAAQRDKDRRGIKIEKILQMLVCAYGNISSLQRFHHSVL